MPSNSQFSLLGQRRFGPLFLTQMLGAFNDNVFRNALLLLIAFHSVGRFSVGTDTLINLSAGLFVLPFFLFSAIGGQLADKYEKSRLIRRIKMLEIVIMLLAAVAFWFDWVPMLMALLFAMGLQSSLFGPVKYGVLPQLVEADELMGANGLIETGTFLAILLGAALGGLLIGIDGSGPTLVALVVVAIAIAGYVSSRAIPYIDSLAPDAPINWNIFAETWRLMGHLTRDRMVLLAVIGISWFWFLGSMYLAQLPNFTRVYIGGNEAVVTLLLTLFSVGVGIGSLMCERITRGEVNVGLVPIGAIGLTLFGLDLATQAEMVAVGLMQTPAQWLAVPGSWRTVADILLLGLSGGLYIVPLYTSVQHRSPEASRSRVIAANNVLNAFFMVVSAIVAIVTLGQGFSIAQLFLGVSVGNILLLLILCIFAPEFLHRCIALVRRQT